MDLDGELDKADLSGVSDLCLESSNELPWTTSLDEYRDIDAAENIVGSNPIDLLLSGGPETLEWSAPSQQGTSASI